MVVTISGIAEEVQLVGFSADVGKYEAVVDQVVVQKGHTLDEAVQELRKYGWSATMCEDLANRLDRCMIHPGESLEMERELDKEAGDSWKADHDNLYREDDIELSDD
jgi:hypothetical protein